MAAGMSISETELLEALSQGQRPAPPEARTATELAQALGLSRTAIKRRLNALHAAGRLNVWWTERPDTVGRSQRIPAYTIKPAQKSARKSARKR